MAMHLYRPILEKERPRYPHVDTVDEILPVLYSQLEDLEVGPPESFNRKKLADMLSTYRKIYPPYDDLIECLDVPVDVI